jgi:hypothetical protein
VAAGAIAAGTLPADVIVSSIGVLAVNTADQIAAGVIESGHLAGSIAASKITDTAAVLTANTFSGNQTLQAKIVYEPAGSPTAVANAGTLTVDRAYMKVAGDAEAATLDTTTAITAGTAGQVVILQGTSATDTLTIPTGSNVKLSGAPTLIQLGLDDIIALLYDGSQWVELYRVVNVE